MSKLFLIRANYNRSTKGYDVEHIDLDPNQGHSIGAYACMGYLILDDAKKACQAMACGNLGSDLNPRKKKVLLQWLGARMKAEQAEAKRIADIAAMGEMPFGC